MSAATDAVADTRAAGRSAGTDRRRNTRAQAAPRTTAPSSDIRIGAEPRVDLLPPEIRTARKREQIVRRMVVGLVAVVALVVAGVIGANALALAASVALTAEQARGADIIQQQQKFASLRAMQSELALVKAAQAVGGATDIDWGTRGTELIGSLPEGSVITNVSIDAATPVAPYQQSTVPGAAPRVASATVTITAPDLAAVSRWLSTLGSLPDVVDTSAGAVKVQQGGTYQATATIHYGVSAWDGKYLPKAKGK
jgi:hypothetical protein